MVTEICVTSECTVWPLRPPPCWPSGAIAAREIAAFKALVEPGHDPAIDGVVRWRCSDLQARLQSDLAVQYHERSVANLLAKLAFRNMIARPFHPEQDAAFQEPHKQTPRPLCRPMLPSNLEARSQPLREVSRNVAPGARDAG
jgi:hypothetical protein